uniref:Seven cysteines N-terminal domain-containing protein n=1 Tax=Sinocyclocheilus rhinocerous TaxID=307959 RepID=A0A673HLW7_9TELE
MFLSCVLLLCVLHVCGGTPDPDREMCYSRQHRDVAVNTRVALDQKGTVMVARAKSSEKDCILTCCSEDIGSGLKCNLVVYKPAEWSGHLNCELFHCPSERDCPLMTASAGVNTYNIFKGEQSRSHISSHASVLSDSTSLAWFLGDVASEKELPFLFDTDVIESDRTSLTTHNKIQINIPKPKTIIKQSGANQASSRTNKATTLIAGRTGGHRSLDESPRHTHWPAVAGKAGDSSHCVGYINIKMPTCHNGVLMVMHSQGY